MSLLPRWEMEVQGCSVGWVNGNLSSGLLLWARGVARGQPQKTFTKTMVLGWGTEASMQALCVQWACPV